MKRLLLLSLFTGLFAEESVLCKTYVDLLGKEVIKANQLIKENDFSNLKICIKSLNFYSLEALAECKQENVLSILANYRKLILAAETELKGK